MTSLITTMFHYTICTFGMLTNLTLLFVIITKNPKEMRTYGTILATSAVVDICVAASSWLTFAKVEIKEIYALTGLCNRFGSVLASLHLFAIAICGHAFFSYNLTLCFCYRLYAIQKGAPSRRATMLAVATILLPNVANVFYFANSDFVHSHELMPELERLNRTIVPDWTYFVFRDLKAFRTYLSCQMVAMPFPIAYGIILVVFLQIRIALKSAASFSSAKSREIHLEITKGLIIQSFLPIIDVFGIIFFWISQYKEIRVEIAGYFMFQCFEIVVSLHPLTALYSIRPYRATIQSLLKTNISTRHQIQFVSSTQHETSNVK